MVDLRGMTDDDVEAVAMLADVAFADLEARQGRPVTRVAGAPPVWRQLVRHRHLVATDSDLQVVAVDGDGIIVGAACALVREGLWGLSLLVVRPGLQGAGMGRRLLDAVLPAPGATQGGVVLSSADPRAWRRYVRAGFDLHPALRAAGVVDGVSAPPGVRRGGPADLAGLDDVDRAVRGAARRADLAALLEGGAELLVADGGYAVANDGVVVVVTATDESVAADLLRAAVATAPPGEPAAVRWLTGYQQWALRVCIDFGLTLHDNGGAVCTRGDVGPFRPHLPSGAFP